ncbi:MAG: type IX secretion system sortase PorU [Bacteroidaceae bacterium]|nr:type IX secretion system sortase PorU [Bacteroidaceae bacterium]
MKIIHTLALLVAFSNIGHAQTNQYAEHSVLASGKWVKIRVESEGVYKLTNSSLKSMGFSNPNNVRLYGYNLPVLPETSIENIYDDLIEIPLYRGASSGNLLFYSAGTTEWTRTSSTSNGFSHFNNPYSKYVYYFLTENDAEAPAVFSEISGSDESTDTQTQTTTYAHSIIETDAYSFLNCGRTFFESYDYANGANKSYSLSLPGNETSDVYLTINFGAAGSSSSSLSVSSSGKTLGKSSFSSLSDYEYADVRKLNVTCNDYSSTTMALTLTHSMSSGTKGHLDYIQACYQRPLSLSGISYLTFYPETSGTTIFELTGCNSNTSVWNVTSPESTYELKGSLSSTTYKVTCQNAIYSDKYIAVNTNGSFPTPEVVGTIKNQDLHSLKDIQLVIIVPANGTLTEQAQRLAAAHTAKNGMTCYVVTADKVYNEFSSGTPDATAYRRFMKMLYDKAQAGESAIAPENILLFGACMWDNRFITSGLTNLSQDDYLLCWESDNSWSHTDSYVLEEYFALLGDNGGSDLRAENAMIGVGRIPTTSASIAKGVVDKLIAYINNENAGSWQNTICLLADDGNSYTEYSNGSYSTDAQDHMKSAETLATVIQNENVQPDIRIKKIYWDSYNQEQTATGLSYPAVTDDINKAMTEGALIMNYIGHGAAYCLSHEQVVKTANFQEWNSPKIPLWITAACDVTPFDMNTENIGVEAINNPDGAAMGFIGTSRTVYGSYNLDFNRNFLKNVLTVQDGKQTTIGQAISLAKNTIKGYSSRSKTNKCHFVLMGDPAISLPLAQYKIVIDTMEGASNDNNTISAGDVITVGGHIEDTNGNIIENYEGIIAPTIFDNQEKITQKNNLGFIDTSVEELFSWYDYTRKLYEGTDSIKNGEFKFSFPVPLDNNYSGENGLISLYAVNTDKSIISNGTYTDFIIDGTSSTLANDTVGPEIITKVNTATTIDGQKVNETPTIYVYLHDESGINATGNGLGHDIVAILDGKESTTYILNDYFQSTGDYTEGQIEFTFPAIEAGSHILTIRAFDTYNNMSEQHYSIEVIEDLEKVIEYYDFAGRLIASGEDITLPRGAYIQKTRYMSNDEEVTHTTKKVLITQ